MLLARKHLKGTQSFQVLSFHLLAPNLAILRFDKEVDGRITKLYDLFNVTTPEIMETLWTLHAGKKVTVTVLPDGADDDKHPEVLSAVSE